MIKNGIYNAAITISGPLINLISIPIATKALGAQSFGEASVAISVISYFTIITTLGLAIYGTRELAQVKNNKNQTAKTFSELLTLSFIASCIGALAYALTATLFVPTRPEIIAVGTFTLVINFLNIEWLFYAHENYKTIAYRTLITRLFGLTLILSLVKNHEDLSLYIAATLLSNVIPFLFVFIKYKKYTDLTIKNLSLKKHFERIGSFLGIRIFASVYTTLDIAIVGIVVGASSAGLYAIAIRVARIVTSIICSTTAVTLPRASALIADDDKTAYNSLLTNTLVITTFLSAAASIAIQLLSYPIIKFLGGNEYLAAQSSLLILSLMVPIVALSNFLGMQMLYPNKMEKTVAFSLVIGSIVCATTMPYLLKNYDIEGGALSILAAELSILLMQSYVVLNALTEIYRQDSRRINRFLGLTVTWFAAGLLLRSRFDNTNTLLCVSLTVTMLALYAAGTAAIKEPMLKKLLERTY